MESDDSDRGTEPVASGSGTSRGGASSMGADISWESLEDAELDWELFQIRNDDRRKSLSDVTDEEMNAHMEMCMKLSAENKITPAIAFDLHLIEYMPRLLKNNQKLADFHNKALVVGVSSEIFGGRVDKIYEDTKRLQAICKSLDDEHRNRNGPSKPTMTLSKFISIPSSVLSEDEDDLFNDPHFEHDADGLANILSQDRSSSVLTETTYYRSPKRSASKAPKKNVKKSKRKPLDMDVIKKEIAKIVLHLVHDRAAKGPDGVTYKRGQTVEISFATVKDQLIEELKDDGDLLTEELAIEALKMAEETYCFVNVKEQDNKHFLYYSM